MEYAPWSFDTVLVSRGFSAGEVTQGIDGGNLDLEKDPKLAWALRHRQLYPVDVNRASKGLLLRIPGIGVRNVERILKIRRFHRIRLQDLARLRITLSRAKWFITTADHNPDVFKLDASNLAERLKPKIVQPSLFVDPAPQLSAITGEL